MGSSSLGFQYPSFRQILSPVGTPRRTGCQPEDLIVLKRISVLERPIASTLALAPIIRLMIITFSAIQVTGNFHSIQLND